MTRPQGRAELRRRLEEWLGTRTYQWEDFDAETLVRTKQATVSVILPARGVEATLGPILDHLEGLRTAGLVDELIVVAPRLDPAAGIASARGAVFVDETQPLADLGSFRGKGDALWRGLRASRGELVVFLDTDTENFDRRFLIGLLGPLISDPGIGYVKGAFHRPLRLPEATLEREGGRVTELVARPLLNLYFPELAAFVQPLAGEVAFRRELIERMRIPVGYGVEIAMLIDALLEVGLEGMAQVDLGERHDANQTLHRLVPMAHAVAVALLSRAGAGNVRSSSLFQLFDGKVDETEVVLEERPALAELGEVNRLRN